LRIDDRLKLDGKVRLIIRTPVWNDFIHLAFAEIRLLWSFERSDRSTSPCDDHQSGKHLPAERHAALRQELELLDRMLEKLYVLPEDLALARIPGLPGLGASSDTTAPKWAA
jgi:hypothetical protein